MPWVISAGTVGAVALVIGLARLLVPTSTPDTTTPVIVDLAGAVSACERTAAREFPPGTARVTVDDHSTRFDRRTRQYRVYLEAVTLRGQTTERHYINCYVAPHEGVVVRFESLQHHDGKSTGGRRFWTR